MDLKTENTPAVPEAREDLDGIPADVAAGLTSEQVAEVEEILRMRQWVRDQNPERAARRDALIQLECERGTMWPAVD